MNALGRFELSGVPLVPGAGLMTTHAAYLSDHRDLGGYDELALEIVLVSASDGPARVIGRVSISRTIRSRTRGSRSAPRRRRAARAGSSRSSSRPRSAKSASTRRPEGPCAR